MTRSTDELIAALAADIRPVRRLKPPMTRALIWIAAAALAGALAVALFANMTLFMHRIRDGRLQVELAATLLTGIAGVIAAFHLSLPDRPRTWALLPLPTLVVWLAASGLGCYRDWIVQGAGGPEAGRSLQCLMFILAASLPLGAGLIWMLGKARPLDPVAPAAVGGLGVAAVSAFLLQFFHPFEVTLTDLGLHAAAVAAVVLLASTAGVRAMRPA